MIETPRADSPSSLLFFICLAGFAFIVLMEYMYPALFRRDTRHLFYFSGLNSQRRNTKTYTSYQVMSIVIFAFTFAALFSTYLGNRYIGGGFTLSVMSVVFFSTLAYLFLRYLADLFLAWLFDVQDFAGNMIEKGIAMRLAFGVYGLALFFIVTYSGFSAVDLGVNVLLWAFLLYIVSYFAVSAEYLVGNPGYFFYFIFYLCIAEICPLLIAWSVLKRTLA